MSKLSEERDRGIDESIREAMKQGKFDNLPGKGKRIQWNDNPFADPSKEMADHILKSNGYTLDWIQERKDLLAKIEDAQAALRRTYDWVQRERDSSPWVRQEWGRACQTFREQALELNKRIRNFNLKAPGATLQLRVINVDKVIRTLEEK